LSGQVKKIVIVGGGSAGWLTAGVLAAEHGSNPETGIRITLIESPDVKPVGVGEGTWPSMRDTLRKMGVSETEFITECDVSFKQASRFAKWVTGAEDDYYYHPFVLPQGYGQVDAAPQWRASYSDFRFADVVSYQPRLCENGRAPKQFGTPEFAAVSHYAYHLDAGKFGQFLQKFCTKKLGVIHILDHVQGINTAANGDITSLRSSVHGLIEGDLFIDCTGFSSLILGQHYGIPFISRTDTLFCDTALAVQIPYEEPDSPIASHTLSTAQSAGWIWDIGLPTRRGVGHVFSSAYTTSEAAERELTRYLEATSGSAPAGPVRKISINPGHRESFWHRNCVAVGISAGFIEPLEASALALIELSALMISEEMPATRSLMDVVARRFNERFRYRWDRIVDFLKLHYLLSQRSDSDFWVDNRRPDTVSGQLLELMKLWRYRSPSRRDFYEIEEIFPAPSYQYVLYGMGFQPDERIAGRKSFDYRRADAYISEGVALGKKYLAGLPSNRELINHVQTHGLQKI
jgi:2-polyprenyl-6-methoxyphenol hydroxylase-like FAD-dependent oxidoreductase